MKGDRSSGFEGEKGAIALNVSGKVGRFQSLQIVAKIAVATHPTISYVCRETALPCRNPGHGSAVSLPQNKWFYCQIPQNICGAKNPYNIELKTTSLAAIQS